MKRPSEILLAARERIAAPGGWCQGQATKSLPRCTAYCLVGATNMPNAPSDGYQADRYTQRVLGVATNTDVAAFNDAPNRTQLECVIVLEKAALLAMSEGC